MTKPNPPDSIEKDTRFNKAELPCRTEPWLDDEFFITLDNDNTIVSITLVVIRNALVMEMMAMMEKMMDFYSLNL